MIIQLFLPIIQLFLYLLQHYNIVLLSFRYVAAVIASTQQLEVLCRAKTWYIDGTCKLCREPFSQLLTIMHSCGVMSARSRSPCCSRSCPGERRNHWNPASLTCLKPYHSRLRESRLSSASPGFPGLFPPLDSSSMAKGIVFILSFCFS